MPTPVLLASTATHWLGTARTPRALAHAGFEVALLAPRNSLAEKSRFVAKIGYLEEGATPAEWVYAFSAMVSAVSPRIAIPCDDMSFRLMQSLVVSPPANLHAALQLRLAALVRESLGNPAHFDTSVNKTLLPQAAEALGIRVPPYALVVSLDDAQPFIARYGYPLVLKCAHGFAGHGVAICANRDQLAQAFFDLHKAASLDPDGGGRLLLQAHIIGPGVYYALAAWKGALLAGWAAEKMVANPEPKGPATVIRYHRSDEIRGFARALTRGFGMSGLLGLECSIDVRTGEAYLLEINRRVTPGTHKGAQINVDLCAALHAAIEGRPITTRTDLDPGEEGVGVHFPQEWLRDPASPYLRNHFVDVPWDDPELMEAMLALRHEH